MKIHEFKLSDLDERPGQGSKLIHSFAALADLGQEIVNRNTFQETIRTSLHLMLGSLAIMRGGVASYSRYEQQFCMLSGRGMGDRFPLKLSLCYEDERQFVMNGLVPIDVSQAKVLPFFQVYDASFERARAEIIVPLVVRDELLGAVLLGEKASGEPYSSHDKEIVAAMCRHIGVAIAQRNMMDEIEKRSEENRVLYENLRATYKDTVKAFATAIDCKDKYTEGHSVRVGKYTEIIGEELGWNANEVEGAATSGYLHDVGKLTVERRIINAPYRINAKESAELNRHPTIGYDILIAIDHPYADVPLAAKYHHERLDGRGYPDGLFDREIPFIAKMVNLSDSFDAMTTDRPYKRRRPAAEVFDDLRQNAGKQFAPEIVSAFFRGMLKEVTGENKDRRFRRLLGREYMEAEGIVPTLRRSLNALNPTSPMTMINSVSTN